MRYLTLALAACFLLSPLEAKTHTVKSHTARVKKSKVKVRKAPKHKGKAQRTV